MRSGKSFKCSNKACGWSGDADANGSQMIRLLGSQCNPTQKSECIGLPDKFRVIESSR
ncbi:hypothetical protein [Microcystis sp. BLCC-F210]|uniref:hypothetical protein n=1 Tax=Microcystis sp. BLCC-F210 TaxID=3342751 RepID=UPI0035C8D95F